MKKLLSILALALCFVACQNEPNIGAKNSDLANVVLNIEAPELATRADADANAGKNSAFGAIDFFNDADWANYDVRYILEVYDVNDNGTGEPIYRERLVNYLDKYAPTTFNLRLVPNREYKFVVFADFVEQGSKDDLYYDTTDLRNITAKTGAEGWNAMNEVRDAYFVTENVEVTTGLAKTLTLKRPFGKVRVIATDLDYIAGYSKPGYVEITYHTEAIYKSFNAVNGDLNKTQLAGTELTYAYEVKKNAPYTESYDAEAKNQTLFADYLFARENQQMPINFTMAVYESKGGRLIKETDFNTQIPVQRNHLTTIIGDVLTTEANITIVVNDDFVEEMINPSMEVAPAAPAVTATVEGNTVTLAWEAVEGAAKYYTRLAAEGNLAEETTELTKVYENLDYETEYTFEVYAMNEKGLVSDTTVVKATTDKKPVVPALATPEVKAEVNGNIVTLTWNEIEGTLYYTVQVNDDEEEQVVNDTTYEFTGEYETEYTFAVKAITADPKVNLDSEAAVVKATTEANVPGEFQPEASEWGVVGDLTNWGGSSDIVMYTTPTENLFVAEKVEINSGAFKIRANKQWNDAKNYGFEVAGKAYADKYYAVITGSGSQNMTPIEYGTYDIYFDLNAKRVAIMTPGKAYAEAEDGGDPIVVIEGLKEHAWGLIGSFAGSDWANDVVMTVDGDWAVAKNVTIAKNNEFKFRADKDWALSYGSACDVVADKTYNTYNNGGNMKFIGETGAYDIYFSLVSAKFYMTVAGAEAPAEPEVLATPVVKAEVAGNTVTLTWAAVENAAQYGITVGTEMPVFVEETTYVFTGEYETEYTFTVVAVPADEVKFAASEAAVVTAKTEAAPVVEPEELIALDADSYYIFKQATEMKGGKWYAIVYENKAATGLTGNYGYLKVTEAAARANGISLPASCAFGFLTTNDGYTIQQLDSKYVYQTGSYDSFNVSATIPADGGIWSVAVEGNEFTITNNAMNKYVQYDSAYNSYGCYATNKGSLPTLYELVEVDSTPAIIDLSTSSLSFGQDAEAKTINVTTYGSATISASASMSWVSTDISGNNVTVSVEANEGEAREAVVTINYGNDSRTIEVSQSAYVAPGTTNTYADTLTSSMFKATGTTYTEFSGVQGTNGAVYAGKTAKSQNGGYIQLRSSKSEDGIVTTASGGKVKKIVVEWDTTNTTTGRTLDVYVRNTAYSNAKELYNTSDTKAGNIVCGTTTELEISGDYEYVGLRSNSGAMYIKSITITYEK